MLSNSLEAVICQQLLPRAGMPGRVCCMEIMIATPAIRNLVREAKSHQITSIIQTSAKLGMITLDDYLLMLYRKGIITGEICLERAQNYDEMRKMMMGGGFGGANGDANGSQKSKATGNAPAEEY
jgi:twitching motility protein PilT